MIGLIYNQPVEAGRAHWESSADVIAQVEAIESSLTALGRSSIRLPLTRDLPRFLQAVEASGIKAAFNLCESIDDDPFFVAHPAALLELLGIPFSGSPSAALQSTTDKHLMKLILRGAGLPTPGSFLFNGEGSFDGDDLEFPVILKPQFQDASIGIDQESVIDQPHRLTAALQHLHRRYGPILVEEYIDGREFNVSVLGNAPPQALPVAEIDFSGMPGSLKKIVGYRAKWEPDSIEYRETKRVFPSLGDELIAQLTEIAVSCYKLFGLRDYGRIDFRMDRNGRLFVLEINANPCLSPDAGFPAAFCEAGLDYTAMVAQITTFLGDRMV
ncbi:MAG: D-alanine--D-alanine ligase [Desulfofustis sp.]|nr:D-alanine--D-alanine ligase [Desulfofustis sp.]